MSNYDSQTCEAEKNVKQEITITQVLICEAKPNHKRYILAATEIESERNVNSDSY